MTVSATPGYYNAHMSTKRARTRMSVLVSDSYSRQLITKSETYWIEYSIITTLLVIIYLSKSTANNWWHRLTNFRLQFTNQLINNCEIIVQNG